MLILTLVARGTSSAIRPVVTTQQAKAGTISQSVQSSGSITASSVLSVSLPEGIVLDNILVKEGQSVVEGQTLATCDVDELFFLNMGRTTRKRKLVEWLESCQENQVSVLDEKIPLLSFAVDFVTAYEYQKARGIKIHPGLWKDMRVDIFLVKKEN